MRLADDVGELRIETGDLARQQTASMMGGFYNQDFRKMIDSVAAAGTPSEVARKLSQFVEAGARRFILMPSAGRGAPIELIKRLFDEVLPAVTSA